MIDDNTNDVKIEMNTYARETKQVEIKTSVKIPFSEIMLALQNHIEDKFDSGCFSLYDAETLESLARTIRLGIDKKCG